MHPLLTRPRQLGLYLLAWVPLAGILVYLLTGGGGLSAGEATAITVPLCLVYAFVCLAAWYPCRATPLEKSGFLKLLLTHLTAAALLGTYWTYQAKELAIALAHFWPRFAGLDQRLAKHYALLWITGVLLYVMSVTFHYVLLAEQASREAQARALEARVLARDAELKALRAQVNPHFLFNCLHSVSALTTSDAGKAREMCILLADFLRTTLRLGGKETITLEEELALVRGYLAIEKVRFGARVRMEENVEKKTMDVLIPPLLLQPLVENAIRHGIANLPEGGVIRLSAQENANVVSILVENSFDPDSPAPLKTGLGLDNIRQRLDTRYGSEASISVRTEGNRFQVSLSLPAQQNGVTA
ncbi:MAG: histidine kinase [Terriglobales bacterium]|jgi:two-component system, LytTR family, sensor histidine kinase AlgZ